MPDPREQAEAVARWMGWTVIKKGAFYILWQPPYNDHPTIDLPDYADDLNAMREVEHEIERRGLLVEYVAMLRKVWQGHEDALDEWQYFLIRATAAQRLEAAARVIEEVGNAG